MRLTRPLAALAFAFALSAPAAASAEPAAAQSEAAESVALGGLSLGVALDNAEYSPAWLIDRELNEIAATGARWVRFDIKWADVQRRGRRAYDWARYDALVWRASARGLRVLANLAYAPAWARPRGTSNKFAPNNARRRAAFARFAAAAGARYRGHVGAWEIWNEPNNGIFWQPRPRPAAYAALLRRTYRGLKRANPAATVLAGATAPATTSRGWIDEVAFIRGVYRAGGRGHFDAWSHHPYDFNLPPGSPHRNSAWWQTYGSRPSIRSVMRANGDGGKQVWATEYGLPSAGYGRLSEATQAAWLASAFAKWRAFRWSGPIFNYMIRDGAPPQVAGHWHHVGLVRSDWTRKPAFAVMQQAAVLP